MSQNDILVPQLDSDLLRSFLAVANAGSVSGGAARLLRTQSAVSLQVQKLEEIVGQRLFDRHGRGVSLTARGEQLLPIARQVVEVLDQAVIAMRAPDNKAEIRLGIPEEYSDTLLPAILADFSQEQPGARILLRCGSSVEFPAALAADELDIALHAPENVTATISSFTVKPPFGPGRLSMNSSTVVRCLSRCLIEHVGAGTLHRSAAKSRPGLRDRLHQRKRRWHSGGHLGRFRCRCPAAMCNYRPGQAIAGCNPSTPWGHRASSNVFARCATSPCGQPHRDRHKKASSAQTAGIAGSSGFHPERPYGSGTKCQILTT